MGEMKDIGKLAASLRRHAKLHEGIGHTDSADAMEDAADLLEPLADLLEKHGPEGVRQLCEAGEKLPDLGDGSKPRLNGSVYWDTEHCGVIEAEVWGIQEHTLIVSTLNGGAQRASKCRSTPKALSQEKGA